MSKRHPLPPPPRPREKWPRGRTGRAVCYHCRRGYGSEVDGLCTSCRGGPPQL